VLLLGFRTVYRAVSLVIAASIVYLAVCVVQVDAASRGAISPDRARSAAVIVVTGTPGMSHMSSDYRAKLKAAWSLYTRRLAPTLIVGVPSGVNRKGVLSAAKSSELAPVANPHDITAVLAKSAGTEFSRVEKRLGRGHRVLIVTDAINALYMEGVASAYGLRPEIVSPSASKKIVFSQISPLFREATGVAVGRVIGFAQATWASK
jgi:hypothetical protein